MQDPAREIAQVVTILTTTVSPDIQKAAVEKFFSSDAGFSHPICAVKRASNSRDTVLGIYQWYRVISPNISIDVTEVVYDHEKNVLFLDITQKFRLRFSPFKASPARLVTKLTLQKRDGLYYIVLQEDFYHPEDLVALVLPILKPVVSVALTSAALISGVSAWVAQAVGIWKPVHQHVVNGKAH